jgi:hypothetical protein
MSDWCLSWSAHGAEMASTLIGARQECLWPCATGARPCAAGIHQPGSPAVSLLQLHSLLWHCLSLHKATAHRVGSGIAGRIASSVMHGELPHSGSESCSRCWCSMAGCRGAYRDALSHSTWRTTPSSAVLHICCAAHIAQIKNATRDIWHISSPDQQAACMMFSHTSVAHGTWSAQMARRYAHVSMHHRVISAAGVGATHGSSWRRSS